MMCACHNFIRNMMGCTEYIRIQDTQTSGIVSSIAREDPDNIIDIYRYIIHI